jgi:hypothetical protein
VPARLKFLRGTWLDPFGRTVERRTERQRSRQGLLTAATSRAFHYWNTLDPIPWKEYMV